MQPQPTGSGSRPTMPTYEPTDGRPWEPPPEHHVRAPNSGQGGREAVTAGYQHPHFVRNSQFYHPKSQRRRHQQPEPFWFTHPHQRPPRPDHWEQLPRVPPHTGRETLSGDPHRAPYAHHPQHYSTLSSHTYTDSVYPPLVPYPVEPPSPPPPLPVHNTEGVSGVDLIKATQEGRDCREETEVNWQQRRNSAELVVEGGGGAAGSVHTDSVPRREEIVKQDEGEVGTDIGRESLEEKSGQTVEHCSEEEEEEEDMEYEGSFVAEVRKFVHRHSVMFDIVTEEKLVMEIVPTLHNLKSEESFKYAEPEALEYHMHVDKTIRRSRFFKLVEPGDVIRGHVVTKRHSGLTVQITSFVNSHKYRELSDLSIRGVLPFENLAEEHDKCDDVIGDMQLDDVVQAVVVEIEMSEEVLVLSFHNNSNFAGLETALLGYRHGRRPVSPRLGIIPRDQFLQHLAEDPGFTNPEAVNNLYQHLGLTTSSLRPTLLRDLQIADYSEEDFAEPLRKEQRFKWSMKTVAVGVDHFKTGKHTSAMQYFNHALDIDPCNVEGLVARGALLATTGRYREGIADFQRALSKRSTHKNARNYFVETQIVLGKELEEQGKIDSSIECYRDALSIDPNQVMAKERLETLTAALEAKTAKLREREREEEEEREKMERVRKVIEKEKKKRLKDRKTLKAKKRKRSKDLDQKRRKKRSKSSKRHYSSSESSADSGLSDEEDGRDRKRRGASKKRARREKERRKEQHKRKYGRRSHSQPKSSRTHVTSSSEVTTSDTEREVERNRSSRRNRHRKKYSNYSSEDSSSGREVKREREKRGGSEGKGEREERGRGSKAVEHRKPSKTSSSQEVSSDTNSDSRSHDKQKR